MEAWLALQRLPRTRLHKKGAERQPTGVFIPCLNAGYFAGGLVSYPASVQCHNIKFDELHDCSIEHGVEDGWAGCPMDLLSPWHM